MSAPIFVIRRPVSFGTSFTINDLGIVIDSGEERDLYATVGSQLAVATSDDLISAINAGDLERLTGFAGSVIPPSEAFDDATIEDHDNAADAHGLAIAQLQNVTDAGSGIIISSGERTKLAGVEAGAEVNDTGAEILTKLQGEPSPLALDVEEIDGNTAADLLDRANHTGTQLASTISDFNTAADARIAAQKGSANGIAELDGSGRVPASQLTVSAFEYKGNWNASTNSPTLTSSVGTQGDLYRVSVAGSTNLDGETDWEVGDQAIFDGSVWVKQDGSDAVTSVNSQQGAVVLDTDDISEGVSNLYYTDSRVAAAPAVVANTAKVSADGVVSTHSDVASGGTEGQLLVRRSGVWTPEDAPGESDITQVQLRLTSDFDLPGTFDEIPFDTIDVETDDAILEADAVNGRIILKDPNFAVLIFVSGIAQTVDDNDAGTIRARINSSGAAINGSERRFGSDTNGADDTYFRIDTTFIIPAGSFIANDYVSIEGQDDVVDESTVLSEAVFIALQLKGPKGEKGDKGDPGSGVEVSIENDNVSLGNFEILNFTDRIQASDAGGGQANVVLEPERYIYYGKSSAQNFTGTSTINFNRLIRDSSSSGDFTVATVSGGTEVTCNFSGVVELSYDVTVDRISGGRSTAVYFAELDSGSGFISIDDSNSATYHRQTSDGENSATCTQLPITVSSGNIIRVRAQSNSGGGTFGLLANGCRLKIKRVE